MSSREIPPAEWQQFSQGFSARHEGGLATLFTQRRKGPRSEIACDVVFRGIAVDNTVRHPSVVVTVEGGDDRCRSHTISSPAWIVVEEDDNKAEVSLLVANHLGVAFTIEMRP